MAKTSWLPKRSVSSRRLVGVNDDSVHQAGMLAAKTVIEKSNRNDNTYTRSSVSGRIDLPNGQHITTVRKDVMDRALGRGEFKKK
jgi:hypothetical protein